ncbi:MAG: carbamoyltransferase HypF [Chthoniobacterales bacterium]
MSNRERARVIVRGAVQGVGFRPFVYRLARELHLDGFVSNSSQGVHLEVEGESENVRAFLLRLERERPPRAIIQSFESSFLDPVGYDSFEIRESQESGEKTALILPDIATCADCLREILDPADRRFNYPFTNCTNCGPRFSIIEALPYDRANTSMKKFAMCAACDREYHDPGDRRFHAQPNACSQCGPQLALCNCSGETMALREAALTQAVAAVRAGKILALKALGGFQLVVDATNDEAIARLRERKHREEKPFAVMVSSLGAARNLCHVSEIEARLFAAAEAPIVLLAKKSELPELVAPRNPNLGLMLPSTPLHHLFLHSLGGSIVATSGNLSDEPICTDEEEAVQRLGGIADLFLIHDRPIVRQMDDSIARIIAGREMILRRARGYAPLPIRIRRTATPILALGGHLKNTVALGVGENVFVSQHIGDLATEPAYQAFVRATADLPRLYETAPALIACDLHPDYLSTKYAAQFSLPVRAVQHHWAHIAACMAENELAPPLLGVSWDGTGYGDDGTIWGGEFLRANADGDFTRSAHLRQFRLPGGAAAVKEPRRCALGLLFEIFGDELWHQHDLLEQFDPSEPGLLRQMLEKQINSPLTSSAGRLFDAVAALLDLRARTSFEGQAAMELEFAIEPAIEKFYPFELRGASPLVIDWQAMISAIIADHRAGVSRGVIAAGFHNTLAEIIVAVARQTGEEKVALSGGCFQNRYLIERTIARLSAEGFRVYWPQRIPPNDGGISLGQIFAASLLG